MTTPKVFSAILAFVLMPHIALADTVIGGAKGVPTETVSAGGVTAPGGGVSDDHIVRWNGTGGTSIQNSSIRLTDNSEVFGLWELYFDSDNTDAFANTFRMQSLVDGALILKNAAATNTTTLTLASNQLQCDDDFFVVDTTADGNPIMQVGASALERFAMQSVYDAGTANLDYALFQTYAASGVADKGKFVFNVDESFVAQIDDDGLEMPPGKNVQWSGQWLVGQDSVNTGHSLIAAEDFVIKETVGGEAVMWVDRGANRVYIDSGTPGTDTGGLEIGPEDGYQTGFKLQVTSQDASGISGMFTNASDTPSAAAALGFRRYRGTLAARAIVQDGDTLARLSFQGLYTLGASSAAAEIVAEADGGVSAGDMPGRLIFKTTPDGTITSTEAMRINNAGNVGIGTQAPDDRLHVASAADGSVSSLLIENSAANDANLDEQAAVDFAFGGINQVARIAAAKAGDYQAGADEDSDLVFYVDENGTLTERMRIHSSGKVTIPGLLDPSGLVLSEQATIPGGAPAAGYATIWVQNDSPNTLQFTNDAGSTSPILFEGSEADHIITKAINDGNPKVAAGSSTLERFELQAIYDTGLQTLDAVRLTTKTESAGADKGRFEILVDDVEVAQFGDNGIELPASARLAFTGRAFISSPSSSEIQINNPQAPGFSTRFQTLSSGLIIYDNMDVQPDSGAAVSSVTSFSDANASFAATANGATTADVWSEWTLDGTRGYALGIDNSDADAFVLSTAAGTPTIGTTNLMRIDSIGNVETTGNLDVKAGTVQSSLTSLTLQSGGNGDINIQPNGVGDIVFVTDSDSPMRATALTIGTFAMSAAASGSTLVGTTLSNVGTGAASSVANIMSTSAGTSSESGMYTRYVDVEVPQSWAAGVEVDAGGADGVTKFKWNFEGASGAATVDPDAEMELDESGNLAIAGTVTSSGVLQSDTGLELGSTAFATPYVDFKDTDGNDFDSRIILSSDGLQFLTGGNGTSSQAMLLNSSQNATFSGDVEIASPTPFLTIRTGTNERGGVLFGSTAHGVERGFPDANDNDVGLWTTSGNIYLSANGRTQTNAVSVDSSGNVVAPGNITTTGGNVSTSASTLQFVSASGAGTVQVGSSTATANTINFNVQNLGAGDVIMSWLRPSAARWYAGIDESDSRAWKLAHTAGSPDFDTDTKLRIDTSGNATLTGTLAVNGDSITADGSALTMQVNSGSGYVQVSQNHVLENVDSLLLANAGTGDVILNWNLPGVRSWIAGVDNSDSDKFKIATGVGANNLSGEAVLELDTSGNMSLDGTLAVNGDQITADGALSISSTGNLTLNPSSNITVQSGTNPTLRLEGTNSASVQLRDTGATSGNQVAGLVSDGGSFVVEQRSDAYASPAARMTVDLSTGDTVLAGTLDIDGNAITSAGALTITPAAGSGLNVALSTTGDFAVNTDDLVVDTSLGRVGVGTASPGYHVHAAVNANSQQEIALFNANTGTDADAVLRAQVASSAAGDPFLLFGIGGVGGWAFGADNSNADLLSFTYRGDSVQPDPSDVTGRVMSLDTSGNVALAGTLDVGGGTVTNSTGALALTSASNSNISITPNGTGVVPVTSATATGNAASITANSLTTGTALTVSSSTTDTNVRDLVYINASGAPAGSNRIRGLHVNNASISTNAVAISGKAGDTGGSTFIYAGYDSAEALKFSVRSNGALTAASTITATNGQYTAGSNTDITMLLAGTGQWKVSGSLTTDVGNNYLCYDSNTGYITISTSCTTSSLRYKYDIVDTTMDPDAAYKLRPVEYRRKNDDAGKIEFGLIAEEVAEVAPLIVGYENDGVTVRNVVYDRVGLIAVMALQKLKALVDGALNDIAELWASHDEHEARIAELEARLEALESKCGN